MSLLADGPSLVSSDYKSSDEDFEEFEIDEEITSNYSRCYIELAMKIFNIVLDDWMYGYQIMYSINQYHPLFIRILELTSEDKILDFLLPGFPIRSPNIVTKGIGKRADFAEILVIRTFLVTARKIQAVYSNGVRVTIMAYYDFCEQLQQRNEDEEIYKMHDNDLKDMIRRAGADDVIRIISPASFHELSEEYENQDSRKNFDENDRNDSNLSKRYNQMLKFMECNQQSNPLEPSTSNETRENLTTGMMSLGVVVDQFLKGESFLGNHVRLSIHNHQPKEGKFSIDLFKQHTVNADVTCANYDIPRMRTPCDHTVLFDKMEGAFTIDHNKRLSDTHKENALVATVTNNGKPWLLIRLYLSEICPVELEEDSFNITMIKDGCGMMIENKSGNKDLSADVINPASVIKEFGVVIMRGFGSLDKEEDLFNSYVKHGCNGIIPWKFGSVHKIRHDPNMLGFVHERGYLPIHWDMVLPPQYMGISQIEFDYEEFTCREFLLYCRYNSPTGVSGATTFVDTFGAVLALNGELIENWKKTILVYENALTNVATKTNTDGLYFGGKGNTYEYPLVIKCPWTNRNVLRWCEYWSADDHPNTSTVQTYTIKSQPSSHVTTVMQLESDITAIAFDERFYFGHTYEEGDLVYVNNYTMLHGRKRFTNERELWRVQLVPPAGKIPEYYAARGLTFQAGE